MIELLNQLRTYVASSGGRAVFAMPASTAAIDELERQLGRSLPPSYRSFLAAFDGGFTMPSDWESPSEDASDEERAQDIRDARWNSIYFRGVTDLVKEFNNSWSTDESKAFIPFCQTLNGESLVFGPPREDGEAPVLDAWHEYAGRPDLWAVLYPDFPTMLREYIANRGYVKTSA